MNRLLNCKMKYLVFYIFTLAFTLDVFSQKDKLNWVYVPNGNDPKTEIDYSIIYMASDHSNNLIISGNITGKLDLDPSDNSNDTLFSRPDYQYFISKISPGSKLIWTVCFQDSIGSNNELNIKGIDVDDSNNIIVTGTIKGSLNLIAKTSRNEIKSNLSLVNNAFILKLNKDGAYLWHFTLSNGNTSVSTRSMCVTKDQNIAVTFNTSGNSFDLDPGTNVMLPGQVHSLFAVYSKDGKFLKKSDSKYFPFYIPAERKNISSDASGNFYINYQYNFRSKIAKFNSNGNLVWAYDIHNNLISKRTYVEHMTLFRDKSIVLYGMSNDSFNLHRKGPDKLMFYPVSYQTGDGFIAMYDSNFNYMWHRQISGKFTFAETQQKFSNNIDIMMGINFWDSIELEPSIKFKGVNRSPSGFLLCKLAQNGQYTDVSAFCDSAYLSQIQCSDQGYYICGYNDGAIDMDPGPDSFIVSKPFPISEFSYLSAYGNVKELKTGTFHKANIRIYPNPGHSILQISTDVDINEISLIDLNAKRVNLEFSRIGNDYTIMHNLKAGIYTICINNSLFYTIVISQ